MKPIVLEPGDGESHGIGSSKIVLKATGETTGETFFMSKTTIESGFPGPPPHVHRRLRDMGAAAAAGPLDPEAIGRIASKYDFERVQP